MGKSRIRAHNMIIEVLKNYGGESGRILDTPAGSGDIAKKQFLKRTHCDVYAPRKRYHTDL
jgi:hypothetical protein